MARVCEHGHEVREGMFVCPACGSDDVRVRDAEPEPLPVSVDVVGQAVARLNSFLGGGILLYLAGGLLVVAAAASAADGAGAGENVAVVLGGILSVIGAGLVLVAIVGWGVKLGNQATERSAAGS